MIFNRRCTPVSVKATMTVFVGLLLSAAISAQTPELIIDVGDTNAVSGEQLIRIPVYMSNLTDTIAGFELWVQMDRPDLAEFALTTDVDIDTTYWCCITWDGPDCVDSQQCTADDAWIWITVDTTVHTAGVIDTAGTLISGWEFLNARPLGNGGYDMKVAAMADLAFLPPVTPGVAPQENGVLFYFVLNALEIPDTTAERTVTLIPSNNLGNICFATPMGDCVGFALEEVPDSSCYICTSWAGDLCLDWAQVAWPAGGYGCDSVEVSLDTIPYLDTNLVVVYNGSLTIDGPDGTLGDFNSDGSVLDISDLVHLVTYMFAGGPPPDPFWTADSDQDGDIDIADLVHWVTIMFPPQ